jgi:hypothetical protein
MPVFSWTSHHKLLVVGAGFAVLVAAVALGLWFFLLRNPTTPVSLRQALRLYRQDQRQAPTGTPSRLPPDGVYRFRTSGGEQLSFGGIARAFPPASDMIVTDAACATLKWEPLEQHMEGLVECPLPGGAYGITTDLSYEEIAGSATTSDISCPAGTYLVPPRPHPGATWQTVCHAANLRVVTTGRVLGLTSVNVGGQQVPAVHTRLTLSFSGAESGTNPNDYWVSTTDGLILAQRETVDVSQQAGPLGSVRYTEQMGISINSATPDR